MFSRLCSFLLILGLVFQPTPFALAQEPDLHGFVEQTALILQMKQKVAALQYRYTSFSDNFERAQVNLEEAQSALVAQEEILSNLDEQIADAKRQLTNIGMQSEQNLMDTESTQNEIAELEKELTEQKIIVGQLTRILYSKRSVYIQNGSFNPVLLVASGEGISSQFRQFRVLQLIQNQNRFHLEKIRELSESLSSRWEKLRIKHDQLSTADAHILEQLSQLQSERTHQQDIFDETQSEIRILESMLLSKDLREEDLNKEIEIYRRNIDLLERKLSEANTLLSEAQKNTLAEIQADMESQFSTHDAAKGLILDWPVDPDSGLTAFFHDGGYQATFGVDHYALDIRARQGSEIHAPADGVVQGVIYNPDSTRYAYILVAHRMGVSTLYGHISAPAVEVGDFVARGQLLGYSGGAPGTPGAGGRTTGSHLHFEVWQDGVRVDPLLYLSLDELDVNRLPSEQVPIIQSALEHQLFE